MVRETMPHLLKGHFSFVKNKIKKRYSNNIDVLKSDTEWYQNVIIEPDNFFNYLFTKDFVCSDLREIVDYAKKKLALTDMRYLKEKYGEISYYYIALEYVIVPIYQRAYEKAIIELENAV